MRRTTTRIAAARKAKPIDAPAGELVGRLPRASNARMMLRVAERLQPKPPGTAMLKHRQSAWGGRHEKSLSCEPDACGGDRRACNGGGPALHGAPFASPGGPPLGPRPLRPPRWR